MINFDGTFYYLDPGTGSYLFQVIIAAGITIGIYFKNLKTFLISFFNKFKKKNNFYIISTLAL